MAEIGLIARAGDITANEVAKIIRQVQPFLYHVSHVALFRTHEKWLERKGSHASYMACFIHLRVTQ